MSGFLRSLCSVGMTDVFYWLLQIQMYNVYGGRLPPLHRVIPLRPLFLQRTTPYRPLPLPMGEVAERKRGRRGSTLMILVDVIIQKRPKALSVSATPSQLSHRESQGVVLRDTTRPHRLYLQRGGRLVAPITVNCQLSTVNLNQLSIVHCQL